ncbi:hypothetical protein HPB51_028813 [Rhipicephalus microplus]|uniref:Uncharacterized protein n=1 Tax=Rhipicephalus microplus TaxID=6941 RepID=A0A9J6CWT3_RHIMP|nr:hypothetical protein HPB51_028813 [Rhipicephalus microplus]
MMDKDGLQYNNRGVHFVARKISTMAQVFFTTVPQRRQATQPADTMTPPLEKSTEVERQLDYVQGWGRSPPPSSNSRVAAAHATSSYDLAVSWPTARTSSMGKDSNFPMKQSRPPKYHVSHCRGAGTPSPCDGHEGTPMTRRHRPRRHKHTPAVNVGFLNLHGVRRMLE